MLFTHRLMLAPMMRFLWGGVVRGREEGIEKGGGVCVTFREDGDEVEEEEEDEDEERMWRCWM